MSRLLAGLGCNHTTGTGCLHAAHLGGRKIEESVPSFRSDLPVNSDVCNLDGILKAMEEKKGDD